MVTPKSKAKLPNATFPAIDTESITQGQLERDLKRTREDMETLKQREISILGIMRIYFPNSPALVGTENKVESAAAPRGGLASYPINEACVLVLKELGNEWLLLDDLHIELNQRGKKCSKASIHTKLSQAMDQFEVKKRGNKNLYRLKQESTG